ncbi:(2Fe-2S)-binding protein [Achromobacter pulmonis]|uniref:(2Fe-2S)-binding protein n=1 Tax=Achromobacter pulmonis TaxID=1389932 RepID=A0A2N8K9U0_9BURK|nr:(2Fe-2S)-binding protein [Achromobacter pulmonis]PND30223.1 (2Fe-2S)-binding protein [Achromobacter pulmonis]
MKNSIVSLPLTLDVNGKTYGPYEVPQDMMMIDVLHEYLNLTGTRFGCGQGECGACTVIVDGQDGPQEVRTCITGAHYFKGRKVRTIEGHARRDADGAVVELSPVQQAFVDGYSFQCGYCTPGFVNAATVLVERLKRTPIAEHEVDAAVEAALDPHLCRCTGYVRYFEAVRQVVLQTPGLVRRDHGR